MHLVSWNVNGLRSCLRKGGGQWLATCGADVICLQETRALPGQAHLDLPGFRSYWNPAERPGYSGVVVLTRLVPRRITPGFGVTELDAEGRVLTVELQDFFVVNVYTPNSQRELARLDFRTRVWDPAFLAHVRSLADRKPVVFCGDLNVSHKEIDLANPRQNRRNAGFTEEERAGFDRLVSAGFIDTFREFESGKGHYTWWSNRKGVREKNIGWRIDYAMISADLRPRLMAAAIHPEVMGSDHCPVSLRLV
jgi:exodeoxyribonuclease III